MWRNRRLEARPLGVALIISEEVLVALHDLGALRDTLQIIEDRRARSRRPKIGRVLLPLRLL